VNEEGGFDGIYFKFRGGDYDEEPKKFQVFS
jgi:hypothetical protein